MKPYIFAVSGVKNSGKTTFISGIIKLLKEKNLKISVIKHDGHDFVPDVPDTDSYKLRSAGADGVAVFSNGRFMIIKEQENIDEKQLIEAFSDSDAIILEGFKYSDYPKIEIVRKENSDAPVCCADSLICLVTDIPVDELPEAYANVPLYGFNDAESIAERLYTEMK